jgi:DNA-binding LytR/AlgR family response regulator
MASDVVSSGPRKSSSAPIRVGEVLMATYLRSAPGIQINDAVLIRDGGEIHRVFLRDLFFLQAEGNYVELRLRQGRLVLRNSLSELLKALPAQVFFQVNRSQAVNILLVDRIGPDELGMGDLTFTLSRRYRDELVGRLPVIDGR